MKERMTFEDVARQRLDSTRLLAIGSNPVDIEDFAGWEDSACIEYVASNGNLYECSVYRGSFDIAWRVQFRGEGNNVFQHPPAAATEFGAVQNMSDYIESAIRERGSVYG